MLLDHFKGLAMAKKCAVDGAKVVIAAKTVKPHPTLPGTIFTAAKEIEEAGGEALPIRVRRTRVSDSVFESMSEALLEVYSSPCPNFGLKNLVSETRSCPCPLNSGSD